jgi:HK97 family phage major capsid protein
MSALLTTKRTELETLKNQAKALYATLEATPEAQRRKEDAEQLDRLIADGETKRAEIKRLEAYETLTADEPTAEAKGKETPKATPEAKAWQSWGQTLAAAAKEQKATANNPNVYVEMTLPSNAKGQIEFKLLREGLSTAGGAAVYSDRQTAIVDNARYRERTLLDLLNTSPTTTNSIDYIAITGFTNNAAETAEWDGTSNYAAKPESDMTTALRNAPVQVIAHFIRASRRSSATLSIRS